MEKFPRVGLKLGVDLGPNSFGWALVSECVSRPLSLVDSGVRVFEAGLDDIETDGKGESRNVQRRGARQRRRMLERTARRLVKLAHVLQNARLLPEGDVNDSPTRHDFFIRIDAKLDDPYRLRARAPAEKLEPYELGRALYHLAQRRGFKSNRIESASDEEERGNVKKGIGDLKRSIESTSVATLGQYFAAVASKQQRIRGRYTGRDMYENEFEKIWAVQSQYHPKVLTDAFKKTVHKTIFHQRPLKSQKHLIGKCQLEPEFHRAPMALLISQRFRHIQVVNNLEIVDEIDGEIRALTEEEREKLIAALEATAELSFGSARKLLGLPKTAKFNLEKAGEKRLLGNITATRLIRVFGEGRWHDFTEDQKDQIVEDLRSIVKEETLKKRGVKHWGLMSDQADKLAGTALPAGYCAFSKQALMRLAPHLRRGTRLQTAIKEEYPQQWDRSGVPQDSLPPVEASGLPEMRNPIVVRALTELRRVINAIIARYGKPETIHIELGRDLRQSPKQRETSWKKMRANERARGAAAERIKSERGIENPSRTDILRVLLAEECGWKCPYTGKQICIDSLIGSTPEFDIEHIIPFDRCLDDSFINKTLSDVNENRNVKRDRTPFEAYHSDAEKWQEILGRVRQFKGDAARVKLRRFQFDDRDMEVLAREFTSRQLNDTRWAAKWAKQYLGLLYGGADADGIDAAGKRRVQATKGGITAFLRREWTLNKILGEGFEKSRADHRHHAIDAIVIVLTDAAWVKRLSDAAMRAASLGGNRLFGEIPQPWEGFHRDVGDKIKSIVVSHRVSKRVRGALHKETFYGKPRKDEAGKEYVHSRVRLQDLGAEDIEMIVDPAVREIVRCHLAKNDGDLRKAFALEANHPRISIGKDESVPIHRVRIRIDLHTFPVGEGHRVRYVQSDANHHMELFETMDKKGRKKWDAEVISMYDAYQRLKNEEPIINRSRGDGGKFLFSLAGGEIIELDSADGMRTLHVVRTVPQSRQIYFVPINDARTVKEIGKVGLTAMPGSLRLRNCRKVVVTPLGEVRYAND